MAERAVESTVAVQEKQRSKRNRYRGIWHLINSNLRFAPGNGPSYLKSGWRLVPATQKSSEWFIRNWEGEMKLTIRRVAVPLMLASALAFCFSAAAQQTASSAAQQSQTYDQRREVSLVGTVIKYDPASSVAPMGAHVLLQVGSGQVDVHLGNARVLQANHFALNAGDSVRIVGETLAAGNATTFAARVVQKGTQAVAVRNTRGFILSPASAMTPAQSEALRGVR